MLDKIQPIQLHTDKDNAQETNGVNPNEITDGFARPTTSKAILMSLVADIVSKANTQKMLLPGGDLTKAASKLIQP